MNGCILVFGMPRSGTTRVGKLLDSHPDTLYRHEPDSAQRLSMPLYPDLDSAPRHAEELRRFVAALPAMRAPDVVGKQPLFAKNYQSNAALFAYRASVLAAKAAGRLKRNVPCPYRPLAQDHRWLRVVWKSIESSGRLGVCMQALPDARAIYLMRHPCGWIASQWRDDAAHRVRRAHTDADDPWVLKGLLATPTGQAHGLTLDALRRLTPEERLAWRWVLTQEKVLADVAHHERVLMLRYEDVRAAPLAMARRAFAFTGLEWNGQTEELVRASTPRTQGVAGTDCHGLYKPSRAAAERWRSELAPPVVGRIMRIVRASSLSHWYPQGADAHAPTALPEVAA